MPTPAETIADRWMAAVKHQDLDALVDLYAERATWHDQALDHHFTGRSGVQRGWDIFSLPGFEVRELDAMVVGVNGAVVRWVLTGSASPFTGRPWTTTGVSVLQITHGEIITETVYYDSADIK